MFIEGLYWVLAVFVTLYCLVKQKFRRKWTSDARLDGSTAIVTGCNTGIGKETVQDLYERGAHVIMACRSQEKALQAKNDIERACAGLKHGTLSIGKLDLSSLRSVREFCSKILESEDNVTLLINNAGVMTCPEGRTEDGFEIQFGSNHLGHFLLTLLLLPKLRKAEKARIVTVSSIGHVLLYRRMLDDLNWRKHTYDRLQAYALSKAANIAFSRELSRKLRENNITHINTYSLHPGVIKTDLSRHIMGAVPSVWLYHNLCQLVMETPTEGAQTTLYCALDAACGEQSGLYYSECEVSRPCGHAGSDRWATQLWDESIEMVQLHDHSPFNHS